MERPRVLILGKLPPPLMGPAIATQILLDSDLKGDFGLHHFDTRINTDVADMGTFKWEKINTIKALYSSFSKKLEEVNPELVLIPIGANNGWISQGYSFYPNGCKNSCQSSCTASRKRV